MINVPRTEMPTFRRVPETTVVVDTDAYSWLFLRPRRSVSAEVQDLRDRLVGRTIVIALQTRAELLSWPLIHSWGEGRTDELTKRLAATPTVPVGMDVCDRYAHLTARCKAAGHGLGDKAHTGDRWIAASAITLGRPLLTLDGVFRNVPDLDLL
jgi:predicted nucleic acid-binding protein